MTSRILVLDGHPDPDKARYGHALAQAYVEGARAAGQDTRLITLAELDVPLLTSAKDFLTAPDSPTLLAARADLEWAHHLVVVAPLWLGSMPAKVRAFFEQIARGGFVAEIGAQGWKPHLKGKSARIIMTMGMPAFAYRLVFGGFGVRSWKRSILGFAGIGPIRETLFGMIEAVNDAERKRRIEKVRSLGANGG